MAGARKPRVTVQHLVDAGLIQIPLELQGTKDHHVFDGKLVAADGETEWGKETHRSLSAAAGAALASVSGYPPGKYPSANGWPPANGWEFWQYQSEDGHWEPLTTLRDQYDGRRA